MNLSRRLGLVARVACTVALCSLNGCFATTHPRLAEQGRQPSAMTFVDTARQRSVPVLIYGRPSPSARLAVLSHGYGAHAGDYSFLAEALVARGWVVASIEHLERPGDPPMVNVGDLAVVRRPVWQIGADSIGFVIKEMRRRGLADRARKPLLVGHSNGGDMVMLFAAEHPDVAGRVVSLDNRRMPLPRTAHPRVCSVRSSDMPADAGVLPTQEERRTFHIRILSVPVKHDDMLDYGTPADRDAVARAVEVCLDDGDRRVSPATSAKATQSR